MNVFKNLNDIKMEFRTNDVKYFEKDKKLPYLFSGSLWYYFGTQGKHFVLLMTSLRDLEAQT